MPASLASLAPQPAAVPGADSRYDGFSVLLHWLTALLVVFLWVLGQIRSYFPKGAPRDAVLSLHVLCGLLVAAVLVVRIAWRLSAGRRLPPANRGWLNRLTQIVHLGLYGLLVVTVLLGLSRVWLHGNSVFGWFEFHRVAFSTRALTRTIGDLHGDFGDIVIIVAGLHAAAALAHHYLLQDSVLRRMLPRKS